MDNTKDGGSFNRPPVMDDTRLKPEAYWSKDEDDDALGNDKALNVIVNGLGNNMFRLITHVLYPNLTNVFKTSAN